MQKLIPVLVSLFIAINMITGNVGNSSNREYFFWPGLGLLAITIFFSFYSFRKKRKSDGIANAKKSLEYGNSMESSNEFMNEETDSLCEHCLGGGKQYVCPNCNEITTFDLNYDPYCSNCKKIIYEFKTYTKLTCIHCNGSGRFES